MYPATNGGLPDSPVVNPTPEYRTRDQGFFFGGGGGEAGVVSKFVS